MSVWHDIKPEDISIDGEDIELWVTSDYSGNIYATVKIKDVLDLINKDTTKE